MASTSSPDLLTEPFASGMPKLVLPLGILWRDILNMCGVSPTLLMDATLFLHLKTGPFEYGMERLVLQ